MIQTSAQNTLTVYLINNSDSETNDIKTFVDLMKVCKAEANKPGFKSLFDDKQKRLINDICEEILPSNTQ